MSGESSGYFLAPWKNAAPRSHATAESMRSVVDTITTGAPDADDRMDLLLALVVLADLAPWGHNLREDIMAMLDPGESELIRRSGWLRGILERERGQARNEGWNEGRNEGLNEGLDQGRREAVEAMLGELFARRLGRALRPEEREALVQRAGALGRDRVEDVVLNLEREALAAWLADPGAR
jgi:predicted transposase YdaD